MLQITKVLLLASNLLNCFQSVPLVDASPLLTTRQSITTLSAFQVSAFQPYSYFAAAGYCNPIKIMEWDCGINCIANKNFVPVDSGGDGDAVQYWFVGYNPPSKEVIVAHQGTNNEELLADLTDTDIFLKNLDPMLFPGISKSIEVHMGFADEQAKSAESVLTAVKLALNKYSSTKVTMVGHSLGGAISLLDSVYLSLHLTPFTKFKTIAYGLPRVGNQAFADYVDENAHLTHINNREDPIPTVPGKFLGFVHPASEVHIQDSNAWDSCPGQDNPSDLCIVGDVPNIFEGNESDHDGPYDGIMMNC